MPPDPSCQLHLSVGPKCPHREMKVSNITPCVISQSNINNSLTLLVFLFLLGWVTRDIIAQEGESRASHTTRHEYFTHFRVKEIEMANNNDGAPQGRPNDSRWEELQSKLQEQEAEMIQIKEQMANMVKMMEAMANMMHTSVVAAPTSSPTVNKGKEVLVEGQVAPSPPKPWGILQENRPVPEKPTNIPNSSTTPVAQAVEFDEDLMARKGLQPPIGIATTSVINQMQIFPDKHKVASVPKAPQAYPTRLGDCDPKESSEWKKEIEKLYLKIKVLQGGGQKCTGDLDDLCFFPKVEVPRKFKVPDFVKFDGTTHPEYHLRAYCSAMGNWSRDENFFLAYFHTSLTGAAYTWYMKLDRANVGTWDGMVQSFLKHYNFNVLDTPTREAVMMMRKKSSESLREYAQRWRQSAIEVHPPLTDYEVKTYFIKTLDEPFRERMVGSGVEDFAKLVRIGEWIEREYEKEEHTGEKEQEQ